MKKIAAGAIALLAACMLCAQEPPKLNFNRPDSSRYDSFTLPDSLAHLSPWQIGLKSPSRKPVRPVVSMTSLVAIPREALPGRVAVLNNNSLRLGRHFTISTGQAWSYGSFPDAYLDARTISLPLP